MLAPQLTDADADRVAAALGDLPLAVEHAGSLLADASSTPTTYLRLLGERADELLDQGHDGAYPGSVTASWAVGFDRLAADDPAALDLLTLIAWCGPEPVPLSLLPSTPTPDRCHYRPLATDPLAYSRGVPGDAAPAGVALTPDLGHAESGHGRGSEMIHDHGPQELLRGVPAAGRRLVRVHPGRDVARDRRGPGDHPQHPEGLGRGPWHGHRRPARPPATRP